MDSNALRHTLAALAYRSAKAVRNAPPEFPLYEACAGARTPVEILAHMGDLLVWALGLSKGKHEWKDSTPLPWDDEIVRYFQALRDLDDQLAAHPLDGATADRLFQGPIADALTHTGQLKLLRRIDGCPVRGENYFKATIRAGNVSFEQAVAVLEFD